MIGLIGQTRIAEQFNIRFRNSKLVIFQFQDMVEESGYFCFQR